MGGSQISWHVFFYPMRWLSSSAVPITAISTVSIMFVRRSFTYNLSEKRRCKRSPAQTENSSYLSPSMLLSKINMFIIQVETVIENVCQFQGILQKSEMLDVAALIWKPSDLKTCNSECIHFLINKTSIYWAFIGFTGLERNTAAH